MIKVKYPAKDYKVTFKQTDKIAFKCFECGKHNVFIAKTSDGRRCQFCDGGIYPLGYVEKIKEDMK